MNYEYAKTIYEELESLKGPELFRLRADMFKLAVNYSYIRAGWHFLSAEEKSASSPARTQTHNAFIDACNILSRAGLKAGASSEWRRTLGQDRKEIGDFACYLTCFLGLLAR